METVSNYVAVPFISGLFNVLLDRLAPENMRELLMGRDSAAAELLKLRTSMIIVRRAINDAEEKQDTDPDVKSWVNEVKHAVYDAEDLVDDIFTEALQKRVETQPNQHVGQVFSSFTATFGRVVAALDPFHQGTVYRIQMINKRFEGFSQLIDVLHLKSGLEKPRALSSSRQTSSFVDESMIYGRDAEKELFIQLLQDGLPKTDEHGNLIKGSSFLEGSIRTFAIVGMPGIGKTTLAQLIFNDPRADQIFEFKSWTCVPDVFDVIQIIKSILNFMSFPHPHLEELEMSQTSLRKTVAGKRSLIVLDDVWDENISPGWQALLLSLKSAAPGSTIIVTTRNEDIAKMLHPFYMHPLHELSHADCWTLFMMHAFGDPLAAPDAKFEAAGRELAAKCGGLPLAVKALGGLLSFTSDVKEWGIIESSKMWDLPSCKREILPALLLSYNYLPAHLKRCFSYCSIFPKNYQFDKDKLVLLWMAEGLIEQERNDNRRMEDIGIIYFRDLVARSFFQVSSSKRNYFVMHDLIHDLAVYVMGEFGFMLEPNISQVITGTPRHLSFKQSKYETAEKFGPACTDRLRTFLPVGSFSSQPLHYISNNLLHSFHMFGHLRLLNLAGYKITSLPPSIGSLKHLRYLDLSFTIIETLPDSICDLLNLQTLLLSQCEQLSILPVMMRNLIHLRHLDIHGTCVEEMPEHIGSLSCLQTLTDFVVSEGGGSSIRELRELSQLRGIIRISGLENVVTEADAFAADLREKAHLDEIVFVQQEECSVAGRDHERLMHALKPHKNLGRLTIDFYEGPKFPDWVGDETFCSLEVLHLKHCPNCVELPSLGQLPSLKHLLIKNFDRLETLGAGFYGQHSASSSPFSSLMTLKFERFPKLKKWCKFEGTAIPFPCLLELYVTDCKELEGDLPLELPSLVVLNIRGCQKLSGKPSDAPFLRELVLIEFGRVDLTTLAHFTRLTSLDLEWRKQVRSDIIAKVQEAIWHLPSLVKLAISTEKGTTGLQPWHLPASIRSMLVYSDEEIIVNGSSQLQHLYLQNISSPLRFPAGHFQLLHRFDFIKCDGLTEFPIVVEGDDLGFTSLHDLFITLCKQLATFPARGFLAPNLTTLTLYGCDSLLSPPNSMSTNFPSLRSLTLDYFPQLESFPEDGFPPHLLTLHIKNCIKLQTLPEAMSSCMSLEWLDIESCSEFVLFPASGLPGHLQKLRIYNCEKFTSLPDRLCSTLKHLDIWKCPKLESFPPCGLPPSLESVQIFGCEELIRNYADWQLSRLIFLKELSIGGLGDLESFPADGSLPTTLNILKLDQFSKLRAINCKELQRIIVLREFEILRCPALVLFSDDLPQSLCRLTIRQSLSMMKRCIEPDGYYVEKISHITCLELGS